jgi:hypothetical protein
MEGNDCSAVNVYTTTLTAEQSLPFIHSYLSFSFFIGNLPTCAYLQWLNGMVDEVKMALEMCRLLRPLLQLRLLLIPVLRAIKPWFGHVTFSDGLPAFLLSATVTRIRNTVNNNISINVNNTTNHRIEPLLVGILCRIKSLSSAPHYSLDAL